ncbi:type II secretion system F family protein [uncultured Methanomethylovorans sp.]|uniref:type II secretion system F family protein n=1 Tax=uncultured Methanomethylovorans sp. TaxID=183759 RepID=UPI002AA737F1|nr:type II secretion system F family protein [uncultured Methanomethylovorans sp.]
MTNIFFSVAHEIFGEYYDNRRHEYYSLRLNMLRNRMSIGYDMYMSGAVLTSFLCAFFVLIAVNLLFYLIGVPDFTGSRITAPQWMLQFSQYKGIAIWLVLNIITGIFVFSAVYKTFLIYPAIMAGERKRGIERMLPYAINYMSSMAGAGVLPLELFRSLASNDIYKDVAVEARYLVRDIEILGLNLVSGMRNLALTTPSPSLQDFLQGAITVITSGGELEPYFKIKTEQYLIENRQKQKEFLETLGLLGETYVTAFVAGPLFMIVVISIMAIMGGAEMIFLYLIIYAIIPFGSAMFILLISSMTPEA